MSRSIICNLCHTSIEEEALLVHLVTKHNWAVVRDRTDYIVTKSVTQPKPALSPSSSVTITSLEKPAPRLGPQGRAILAARSKPTPCRFCNKMFPADSLLAHVLNCPRRQKIEGVKPTKSIGTAVGTVSCPHCGIQVKRLAKHIKKVHPAVVTKSVNSNLPTASTTIAKNSTAKNKLTCPYCKTAINEKNYATHIKERCPKRLANPASQTASTARLPVTCHDPEIAAYLARNPAPETIGPQGTPQAKIRQGTYGLAGMEYDSWGRGK